MTVMAKHTVKSFFNEIGHSMTSTPDLPQSAVMRATLINTLCEDTTDDTTNKKRKEYVCPSEASSSASNSEKESTFANIIGMKALNIFNWPYLIATGTRQLL